jgi:hypothetical protein
MGDAPVGYFFPIYQGLERGGAALTRRQGAFAEDLLDAGTQAKSSGIG